MKYTSVTKQKVSYLYILLFLFVVICIGLVYIMYTNTNLSQKLLSKNDKLIQIKEGAIKKDITKEEIAKKNTSNVSVTVTSSTGKKVTITFTRCDTFDLDLCFGHESKLIEEKSGVLLYAITSTDSHLYFGSVSNSKDKWPYLIDIYFEKGEYDEKDYKYFKNKIPALFFQNIKISQ